MASELAFYPGRGDAQVVLDDPSRLTGRLLARVDDIGELERHPDIAAIRVLPGRGDVVAITPAPGVSSVALANALHDRPGTVWAHPDLKLRLVLHARPDDPLLEEQWHLVNEGQRGFSPGVDINAEEAWDITAGAGTLVAVLDSGTDIDHPDLVVIDGRDFVDGDASSDPDNNNNHGTAVAGLIGATGNNGIGMAGVAYEADIYASRIIASGDSGGGATSQEIYESFVAAIDAGADVVNNSWGVDDGNCRGFQLVGALQEAFEYAETEGRDGLGAVNVFAAGNSGCDLTNDGILSYPSIVGVGAVNGFDRRAGYSNFGPWVDVAAPSGDIATTDLVGDANGNANVNGDLDYTRGFGGTSAAAPQVAGTAALMISVNPRITAAEVRQVLCDTAVRVDVGDDDYDVAGRSPQYGCGRIDAGAAVRAVRNEGPPDAPIVAAADQTSPDSVVLRWPAATDPDGDPLQYRVRWAYADDPDNETVELVDRLRLDLTEAIGGVEDTVLWRVRAIDPWGAGDWSETQTLAIVAPEEPTGCRHVPFGASLGLIGLLGLVARRRHH